jgi:hypothetical protein
MVCDAGMAQMAKKRGTYEQAFDQKRLSTSSQELVNTRASCDHLTGPTISRCRDLHDSLASYMVGDFNKKLGGESRIPGGARAHLA